VKRRPPYSPNQRARRINPNCPFSPTRAKDALKKLPVGNGNERTSTSTRPTLLAALAQRVVRGGLLALGLLYDATDAKAISPKGKPPNRTPG